MYLCLPNAELEQINEQEDVAVATLNAPSLAEICIAIGRGQKSKKAQTNLGLNSFDNKAGGKLQMYKETITELKNVFTLPLSASIVIKQ